MGSTPALKVGVEGRDQEDLGLIGWPRKEGVQSVTCMGHFVLNQAHLYPLIFTESREDRYYLHFTRRIWSSGMRRRWTQNLTLYTPHQNHFGHNDMRGRGPQWHTCHEVSTPFALCLDRGQRSQSFTWLLCVPLGGSHSLNIWHGTKQPFPGFRLVWMVWNQWVFEHSILRLYFCNCNKPLFLGFYFEPPWHLGFCLAG